MMKETRTIEEARKDFESEAFWNLCLILEEIVGVPHKELSIKYRNIGVGGVTGVIIAEIRRRKYEGDKLREKIDRYSAELTRLGQLELFKQL